jgi:hypothetical protein
MFTEYSVPTARLLISAAGIIRQGDLDNRIKTLIDTLRKPKGAMELRGINPQADEDPLFCLLEDDDLVTGLTVETGMLLGPLENGASDQSEAARIALAIPLRGADRAARVGEP